MVTFDDVLPTLARTCESHPGFADTRKLVITRDLRGRVHLAIQTEEPSKLDLTTLETSLTTQLGPWFVGPILGAKDRPELSRLRATVLNQHAPWECSWEDPISGKRETTSPGKWHLVERHLSKLAWTDPRRANLPWPLVEQRPAIVTFFSFKGGVGRTTLLSSMALQLAQDGKRVIAIDMDVEAPGLGSLLGATTRRGVVDFLVDHYATGTVDMDGLVAPATALEGPASLNVEVIPAGVINSNYFEKLARLDFVGTGLTEPNPSSPARDSLRVLVESLSKRTPAPDYIFIDSRAGLHDVAGLALHDLAHVDVIVGRDSDQTYSGLELTVAALGQRRSFDDLRCIVVQSMAPDDPGSEEYARVTSHYRQRSYDAFTEHVYSKDPSEDDPDLDDDSAAHFPLVIRFDQRLINFSSLHARQTELLGTDYTKVKDRIIEQCTPEKIGARQ